MPQNVGNGSPQCENSCNDTLSRATWQHCAPCPQSRGSIERLWQWVIVSRRSLKRLPSSCLLMIARIKGLRPDPADADSRQVPRSEPIGFDLLDNGWIWHVGSGFAKGSRCGVASRCGQGIEKRGGRRVGFWLWQQSTTADREQTPLGSARSAFRSSEIGFSGSTHVVPRASGMARHQGRSRSSMTSIGVPSRPRSRQARSRQSMAWCAGA